MIRNQNVRGDAGIDSFKSRFSYDDNATFLGAKREARGVTADPANGDLYYDEALGALRLRSSGAWVSLATDGTIPGSIDDVYSLGNAITRDGVGAFTINDSANDALADLSISRTNGSGVLIQLANSGSGADIAADAWTVTNAGRGQFSGMDLDDAETLLFGTGDDVSISYDGASNELRIVDDGADGAQVVIGGADGTGTDLVLRGATAGASVLWDQSVDDLVLAGAARLVLQDSVEAVFGTGDDVTIAWDGTNLDVLCAADDSQIVFGADGANAFDLLWHTGTAGADIVIDASADRLSLDGVDLRLEDDDVLQFGDSADVTMSWISASSRFDILPAADDTEFRLGDGTTSWDLRWYGATASDFVLFDASANRVTFTNVDIVYAGSSAQSWADSVAINFGTSNDASIQWNGTTWNFEVAAANSEMRLGSSTVGLDLRWYAVGTSGSLVLDTSAGTATLDAVDLYLGDSDNVSFGDAQDVVMQWNGSLFAITAAADDTNITVGADGANAFDLIWHTSTAGADIVIDASNDQISLDGVDLILGDSDELRFGDASGGDINLTWNATNLVVDWAADDTGAFHFGVSGARGGDLVWYSAAGAGSVTFNAGNAAIVTSGVDLTITEADIINLGATTPVTVTPTAGVVTVAAGAANDVWNFGEGTTNLDLRWYGSAAGNNVLFDASADEVLFAGISLHLGDNERLEFGDAAAGDVSVLFDATNLVFATSVANTVVEFGEGTTNIDLRWFGSAAGNTVLFDASADEAVFNGVDIGLQDDDVLNFGDSDDVVMQWQTAGGFLITGAAADSTFELGASGGGNQFDLLVHFAGGDLSSDASGNVLALDGIDLRVEDSDLILFGDAGQGISVGYVNGSTELQVRSISAALVDFDGVSLQINDSDTINFGDAADMTLQWNGTNLVFGWVADDTGAIHFGATGAGNSGDMVWFCGGAAAQVLFDEGNTQVTFDAVNLQMGDNDLIEFGDAASGDITLGWDASNLKFLWAADDTGAIIFGANGGNSGDVQWYAGAAFVNLNRGSAKVELDGIDLNLFDADILQFGDSQDVALTWVTATTSLDVTAAAGDATILRVGTATNEIDLIWTGATGTITLDSSAGVWVQDGIDLYLRDSDILGFGDAGDVFMTWNGTQFVIDGAADDFPIYIGDGTTNPDLRIYGSAVGNYIDWDNDGGKDSQGLLTMTNTMLAIYSSAPASAGAAGTAGELTYDSDYIYVCIASGNWKRANLATW